ncbi:SH3 domain-containing protein [Mesorhizobium sp. M7D.F.Ca.US.005.01.1.1]|uniref:SH3 domain-containing protein n=2 Tax=Rhizobium loti TaxID=381 RepID=A0A8E2WH85_RHILI|nr:MULTISPECIES: SH3 domain-containing protein [Mesorhizobium]AZO44719.1 SH3 domain-containing protein [Mesorhizobium sp. M7D.F.Ca.US.005.01.1.1]PWJ94393.1 SH3 domain-containing protein [Mesorhizobium loti]
MMRRTVTLRTTLHALIAVPLLMAAWLAIAPTMAEEMAEEAPELVISIVTGLAPDDLLNLRTKPSPIGKTETRLASGARVKNLGCNDIDGHQWCKVESDDPKASGWAPARYLIPLNPAPYVEGETKPADAPAAANSADAVATGSDIPAQPQPPPDLTARLGGADPVTGAESTQKSAAEIGRTAMQDAYGLAFAAQENPTTGEIEEPVAARASTAPPPDSQTVARLEPPSGHAANEIPCARYVGEPMTRCAVSVVRKGSDKADVTITWPDGGTRIISFVAGQPAGSDAPSDFRFTREGSLNMIRVGVSERFEITDQLALGD